MPRIQPVRRLCQMVHMIHNDNSNNNDNNNSNNNNSHSNKLVHREKLMRILIKISKGKYRHQTFLFNAKIMQQ